MALWVALGFVQGFIHGSQRLTRASSHVHVFNVCLEGLLQRIQRGWPRGRSRV